MLALEIECDNNHSIAHIALAFVLGFANNSIGSQLQNVYFFTFGGKPSNMLLRGKDIMNVRFFESEKARRLLLIESENPQATNGLLFAIAQRVATNSNSARLKDFHAIYVFSRSMLTAILVAGVLLSAFVELRLIHYLLLLGLAIIFWWRCRQQSYYYAREVLSIYLYVKENE